MTDPVFRNCDEARWEAWSWGHDRVLVRRYEGAIMAVAIGPPMPLTPRKERLAALIPDPTGNLEAVVSCRQVHGATIHRVTRTEGPVIELGEGDGLVATSPGVGLLVWTADCVPILMTGPGVVAAIHSGWRGCAADVLGAAITELRASAGVEPEELTVALGPSVCGECYTVGPEVTDALGRFGLDEARWRRNGGVDLRGFLSARAESRGVPAGRIETVGGCTAESPALASYRRDGAAAGRQWAMVFLDGG